MWENLQKVKGVVRSPLLCLRTHQGFCICHMINYTGYNQKWNVGKMLHYAITGETRNTICSEGERGAWAFYVIVSIDLMEELNRSFESVHAKPHHALKVWGLEWTIWLNNDMLHDSLCCVLWLYCVLTSLLLGVEWNSLLQSFTHVTLHFILKLQWNRSSYIRFFI